MLPDAKGRLRFVTASGWLPVVRSRVAAQRSTSDRGRSVTVARSAGAPNQPEAWRERVCIGELVWLVEDFLDFFLAWCDFDDFFFFVLVVGADEVEASGAMVCPPPVVA
jgi:hypothetical protein